MFAHNIQHHLNLKRIVHSAKQDRTIFKIIAEPLLDGQSDLTQHGQTLMLLLP